MKTELYFEIQSQPNDVTCGPTCLQAVYNYYDDPISLEQVIDEVQQVQEGGTLAVLLACHALKRGYKATIYSYNLQVFDPTWFGLPSAVLQEKLRSQLEFKTDPRLQYAIHGYLRFLELGGVIRFEDLNSRLFQKYLKKEKPILTGLSATFLYRSARENLSAVDSSKMNFHDLMGEPTGHFVVLCGYDKINRKVLLADPLYPNPNLKKHYEVDFDRLICSILLGVLTFDANLLVIEPKAESGPNSWKR